MKNRKTKGEYGYRDYHKKIQILKVLFGASMILVQLAARNFTDDQAMKNILTVMAVLSVLPTANVASPLFASFRYKTIASPLYQSISSFETKVPILYDLIITSKEAVMPMDAIAVHPTGIIACCTLGKIDEKKSEAFLKDMLTAHKLDPNVKIIKEEKTFLHRLETLRPFEEYEDDGSIGYTLNLLKNLSM